MGNVYQFLVRNPEGKIPLWNIKRIRIVLKRLLKQYEVMRVFKQVL
jgi:hypothetical protein